jgi:hypothetical protein
MKKKEIDKSMWFRVEIINLMLTADLYKIDIDTRMRSAYLLLIYITGYLIFNRAEMGD